VHGRESVCPLHTEIRAALAEQRARRARPGVRSGVACNTRYIIASRTSRVSSHIGERAWLHGAHLEVPTLSCSSGPTHAKPHKTEVPDSSLGCRLPCRASDWLHPPCQRPCTATRHKWHGHEVAIDASVQTSLEACSRNVAWQCGVAVRRRGAAKRCGMRHSGAACVQWHGAWHSCDTRGQSVGNQWWPPLPIHEMLSGPLSTYVKPSK